ncbi:Spermatogenesis-associated protein 20 [Lasiodiplodia hormozganensis]|uniref:Spermatogenesis-associated protein 20 n=1 Tax=Lasiodiplodia hormozganensis TaxID=869390 RepID=A0AA39XTS8_9PEZI|nr:Spermatogenesis-associated protein 20 [Lasiodiplodia hormozganensis]
MDVRNLAEGGPVASQLKLVNRLSESRSPYVRGHMHNPVAWQTWGPEALDLARKTNRLLFVSIGYAACHWCHVMERESFENPEIANILNNNFIPVKVDREERPDVDRIYMNYVQATTGSGGWPLNVFITPDLEPIFGGTYWPGPGSTTVLGDHPSFLEILERIKDVWQTQRQRCLESAKEVTAQLREFAQEGTLSKRGEGVIGDGLDLELLEEAYTHFANKYDKQNAGFGKAPKFPTPANLSFLLRLEQYPEAVEHVVGDKECVQAKEMAVETLRRMTRGGIHDQVGNGFARYSVTQDWSLPHFEKMLYDQAQLLTAYLDAHLVTKDTELLDAAHDIATYLTSPPLQSADGGFFSSEDADSLYRPNDKEKREGAFYVWTRKEFKTILGEKDAEVCGRYFNVRENGNVSPEHDAHDELINQNVLAINSTPEALAKEFGLSKDEVNRILESGRKRLLEHRNKERPRPSLDDKIVVSWNGLAIGALARFSAFLEATGSDKASTYRQAAEKAVRFIKSSLYNSADASLKRVYRQGPGEAPAFADDYAFLISGLIDLYEATFDDSYLEFADQLQRTQIKRFWDTASGGFFSTAEGQSDLILRLKDGMDNAEPSTNGVSAGNLYRLGALLEDADYTKRAKETCEAFEAEIMQHPFLFPSMLSSIVALRLGMKSIVATGKGDNVEKAVSKARSRISTNTTVARLGEGAKSEWLRKRNELFKNLDVKAPRVQICEGGVCKDELDMADMEKALREVR